MPQTDSHSQQVGPTTEPPMLNVYQERGGQWAGQQRVLSDGRLNKGLGFSLQERQALGIHGLLPPTVRSMQQQVQFALQNIVRLPSDLDRHVYLMDLLDRNEKLFYRLVTEYIENMVPLLYTPTVGFACQKYGLIWRRPRGLFITINDRGHIYDLLCNWPEPDVRAICVTDGERILGLGDLGALGMGIPIGKLILYTACALIKPHQCLPITLDVGTNNEELLKDPLYVGLRKKRAIGHSYDAFIDEFMHAVARKFGHRCLIQFEDFGNHHAFKLLSKYRNHYCTFNDDIQGTAAVAVAALLASTRLTKKDLRSYTYLFVGAGEAAIGISRLLMLVMHHLGMTKEEAQERIWLMDSHGLVVKDRPNDPLSAEKTAFAKHHQPISNLLEAVEHVHPTALIGVCAVHKIFTESVLRRMAAYNEKPVVFALSNPNSKAECTAEEAYQWTEGRCVFVMGSPSPPVQFKGVIHQVSQCNNAYIYPGVALGIIASELRHVTDEVFLLAAQELAHMVTERHLAEGRLFPQLTEIHTISNRIAMALITWAYKHKMAGRLPEPINKEYLLKSCQYHQDYEDYTATIYPWKDNDTPRTEVMSTFADDKESPVY